MPGQAADKPVVAVVNCGSSKVPDIEACLNELGAATKVLLPGDLSDIETALPDAIVLSGNPALIRDTGTGFLPNYAILPELDLPILGICFGHQVIGLLHSAAVTTGKEDREMRALDFIVEHPLFAGIESGARFQEDHTEQISVPAGFVHLASSSHCLNEAMAHPVKPLFGVQCHPELSGENGKRLFANFLSLLGP